MRKLATRLSLVLATTLVVALAAPAGAHQLGRRGGPVITCPTVGVHIRSVSQHSLRVTGFLRVGNNSHVDGHDFFARVHFWTSWADRYFEVRGHLDAFSYNRYHFRKFIAAQNPNSIVHWNRVCYPTD
jgi:hypothetical protein